MAHIRDSINQAGQEEHDHEHGHHDHHDHPHDHSHHDHHDVHMHAHPVVKNLKVAFIINIAFAAIEFVGGAMTNSVAILSDAIHDLGDGVIIGVSMWMEKFSKKGRSAGYTYGYKRFSTLAAFLTSVVLLVGSALIVLESVPRLFHPQEVHAGGMLGFAIAGIIFNGLAMFRLRDTHGSLNQKAVMLHMLEDILGWVAVLVGSIVIYYTHWYWIDPLMSLAIAGFILFNAGRNILAVSKIFLQSVPQMVDEEKIVSKLGSIEHVTDVHDIHIWSMDGLYNVLTVHLVVDKETGTSQIGSIREVAIAILKEENIQHPTVQIEFPTTVCDFVSC